MTRLIFKIKLFSFLLILISSLMHYCQNRKTNISLNTRKLESCDYSCKTCDESPTNCIECSENYFRSSISKKCEICDSTCLTCQDKNTKCISCAMNYSKIFNQDDDICYPNNSEINHHYLDTNQNPTYFRLRKYQNGCQITDPFEVSSAISYGIIEENDCLNEYNLVKTKKIIYSSDGSGLTYLQIVIIADGNEISLNHIQAYYNNEDKKEFVIDIQSGEKIIKIDIHKNKDWITAIHIFTNKRDEILGEKESTDQSVDINFKGEIVGFKAITYVNGIASLQFKYLIKCDDKCYTCKEPDYCLSCELNFYLKVDEPGKCLTKAPSGYYIEGRYIKKCNNSCSECSGSEKNCLSCANNFFPKGNVFPTNCFEKPNVEKAYEKIYFDGSPNQNYFKPCHPACNYCFNGENNCYECNEGYFNLENTINFPAPCYNELNNPVGYFISFSEKILKKCDISCNSCKITAKNCIECANNFYIIKGELGNCYNSPPNGYYLDKKSVPKIYKNCDTSCKACNLRPKNCLICSDNFFPKIGLTSVCYDKTQSIDGFYLNESDSPFNFVPCHPSCKKCPIKGGSCTECANNYFFKSDAISTDICYKDSPSPNYIFNTNINLFEKCGNNCAECLEAGDNNCTKCNKGYFFIEDNYVNSKGQCVNTNPGLGYYFDINIFRRCNPNCLSCQNGTDTGCTACNKSFFPIYENPMPSTFKCYAKINDLPSQSYFFVSNENIEGIFMKCPSGCKTCNSLEYCIECNDGFYKFDSLIFSNSLCYSLENKPFPNLFLDSISKTLKYCSTGCGSCEELGVDNCTSCNNDMGFYFKERSEFYYPNGFDYLQDDRNLQIPKDLSKIPSKGKCFTANEALIDGFSIVLDNLKIFKKCTPNCKICKNAIFEGDCFQCATGYRKLPEENNNLFNCYKSPPNKYFINDQNISTLENCHFSCNKCSGPNSNDCLECIEGYYKIENESFPTNCQTSKNGYFIKENVLKKCDDICEECLEGAQNCLNCNSSNNYYQKSTDNQKYKTCYQDSALIDNYFFYKPYFIPCFSLCKSCINSDINSCSSCVDNSYPIDTEFQTYIQSKSKIGEKVYFQCYDKKPNENYWLDTENKFYRKCADNCLNCLDSSDSKCLVCASGYFFKFNYNINGDRCYRNDSPPADNYFLNNNLWQICDISCEKCIGGGKSDCLSCAKDYFFQEEYSSPPNRCFYKDSPPSSNYVLIDNLKFFRCTDNCHSCYLNSFDKCKSCTDGSYFKLGYNSQTGDICYKSTPSNFYLALDNLYKPCDISCDQCSENANECISCNEQNNYYRKLLIDNTISKECFNQKPEPNYFLDGDIYKKCSENCGSCESFGVQRCTSCSVNFYSKNEDILNAEYECFNSAPFGYYLDNSKFHKCTRGCSSCLSQGIKFCLSCDVSLNFFYLEKLDYINGAECYDSKPSKNTYLDFYTNTYKFCHSTCKNCLGGSESQCTECLENYYFRFDWNSITGDKCYNNLPLSNMFLDLDHYYKFCHESCLTCDRAGDKCLKCAPNRYFKSGYEITGDICYSSIPFPDYYLDRSNSLEFLYKKCSDYCSSCNEYGYDKCISCKNGYYFKEGDEKPNQCFNNLETYNYYLDTISKTYKLCNQNCATCSGPESNKCNTCINGYHQKFGFEIPSECFTDLYEQSFYLENNYWKKCSANCKICVNGTEDGCSICSDNFYYKENFSFSPNKCYSQIPDKNYYFNGLEKLFKLCSSLCKSCNEYGFDKCTECIPDSYLREESLNSSVFACYNNKPEVNYYLDQTNISKLIYRKCDISCYSCNLGSNHCTICNTGYYFKEGFNPLGDICYNKIPQNNFYLDLPNKLYKQCNSACQTCSGGTSMDCLICNIGYYMIFSKTLPPMGCFNNNPEPNYYLDKTDPSKPIYKLCHFSCSSCRSFGISKCDTCIANYYFSFGFVGNGNRCFNNKPFSNYYLDKTELIWKPCYYNCLTCIEGGLDKCLTCSSGTYFKDPTNKDGDICYDDLPSQNYFFDEINSIYKKCDLSCGSCDGLGQNSCITCANNFYQKDGETGAHLRCYSLNELSGYFIDLNSNTLKACIAPCLSCSSQNIDNCLSCQTGFYLKDTFDNLIGDVCYNSLPAQNYYLDLNERIGFYKLCSSNCDTCIGGGNDKCKTCAVNYYFKQNYNNILGDICYLKSEKVTGFYFDYIDNLFKQCSPNCEQCVNFGEDQCLECRQGFYFINNSQKPNKCYGDFPEINYYLDKSNLVPQNWVWKICDSSCNTCSFGEPCESCLKGSPKYCLSCANGFYFKENHITSGDYCYNRIPSSNYFIDMSLNPYVYRKCHSSCATCIGSNSNQCSSCISGAHFKSEYDKFNGDTCFTGQINGFFLDNSNRVNDSNSNNIYYEPCHSRCKYCTSKEEGKCTACYQDNYFIQNFKTDGDFCYGVSDSLVKNYYLDKTLQIFLKCDESCESCINYKSCLKCSENYYQNYFSFYYSYSSYECFKILNGSYLKEENLLNGSKIKYFKECNNPGCKSCNNYGDCLTCYDNYYFKENYYVSGDDCYNTPPDGYYLDSDLKVYKKCHSTCATCKGPEVDSCLSCPLGNYLFILQDISNSIKNYGGCYNNPPLPNYYKDELKKQFLICNQNCKTCNGPNENDCLSCPNNSYFIINYNNNGDKCHSITPDFYYLDITSDPIIFKICSYNCLSCSGPEDDKCLKCRENFHFKNPITDTSGGFCESNVPIANPQQLVQYIISNPIPTTQCSFNCLSCTSYGEDKCIECSDGFYFIENFKKTGDICYKKTPYKNYYLDKNEKVFKACSDNCGSCKVYGEDKCLSCQDGYYFKESHDLIKGDFCYKGKLENYYLDQSLGIYKYCNMISGSQYLEIEQQTKKLRCKSLSMIDLSVYDKIVIPNIKVANARKYTIQFWFNLLINNFENENNFIIPFKSEEVIWDLHMKIRIENINNKIFIGCFPIYDSDNSKEYEELYKKENIINSFGKWIRVSCSTDQINSIFNFNKNESLFDYKNIKVPDLTTVKDTELIIKSGEENNNNNNYGFLFIKEFKLWTLYNNKSLINDCKYIIFKILNLNIF